VVLLISPHDVDGDGSDAGRVSIEVEGTRSSRARLDGAARTRGGREAPPGGWPRWIVFRDRLDKRILAAGLGGAAACAALRCSPPRSGRRLEARSLEPRLPGPTLAMLADDPALARVAASVIAARGEHVGPALGWGVAADATARTRPVTGLTRAC
jgi:hypothetical protein